MRPDPSARFVVAPARFVIFAAVLGSLLLTALPAAAQPPGVNHRRGQAAIDRLGSRLPAVAAQHNMAAARLRELFLTDPYIAVDEVDNLLFIDEFVPEDADAAPAATIGTGGAPLDLAQTFLLHSLPGATKVIYLDFNGHATTGTAWNNGYGETIVSAPYSTDSDSAFSAAELECIQYIWQRVAEDFLPYGVDVTTQDPGVESLRRSGTGDTAWGQRVVISPTNWYNTGAGGVAYIGAFNWSSDTPCFVFTAQLGNGNEKYTAEAASHEAGHTVGLYHDGVTGGSAYYRGHNGWAPIMGVGYYQGLVQWSKGEYPGANNAEDDLTVVTGYGFTYRPDDHADAPEGATPLVVKNATNVSGSGIIEQPADKDSFSFLTGAGSITLHVSSPARSANLDIRADLYDSAGVLIGSHNPPASMDASISATVNSGTCTLVVEGVGNGDLVTGYSDYGSLGEYTVAGTIVNPGVAQPPVAVATATPASGDAPLSVQFGGSASHDSDGGIATYSWDFGDGSAGEVIADPVHVYQEKGVYTAVLTVVDKTGWSDTASVVITATGPPAAPGSLTATTVSSSQINLAWLDRSDDEDGFTVERMKTGETWAVIATPGAGVQSYSNTGLSPSTTHQYRVRATNGYGASLDSNTASATTAAPAPPAVLHIGDLDGTRSVSKRSWTAKVTITVHDAAHKLTSGAVVTGSWDAGGSGSCTTGGKGTCTVSLSGIPLDTPAVTFAIGGVTKTGTAYDGVNNEDPDGLGTKTAIRIVK